MKRILIVAAGFAGMYSAFSAARHPRGRFQSRRVGAAGRLLERISAATNAASLSNDGSAT